MGKKAILEQGKWHFILGRWVLGWGSLMAFLMILVNRFIWGEAINGHSVVSSILMFWVGGLIAGMWTWSLIPCKRK